MAIDKTYSAARRRNVSPKSSTLHVQTRDVDCSGLELAPEDGQFILLGGADPSDPTAVAHAAANADVSLPDAEGAQLRMVWGSARRSDRAALSGSRTTVFAHGPGIDLDVKLYNADKDATLQSQFPVGTLLSVADALNVLTGVSGDAANKRLVLEAMSAGYAGWCVGFIRETVSGDPGNDTPIKIHLYGTPRYVGSSE